jgi:hypothetical protein
MMVKDEKKHVGGREKGIKPLFDIVHEKWCDFG